MTQIYRYLVLAMALVATRVLAASESPAANNSKPNILIILADDLGWSDLGCYGSEIKTPNLDQLAADGLRFTQFYNSARCCPSRASLLTGLYPHQAGVGSMTADEGPQNPGYRGRLNHRCVTIGEVLRGAGYGTYACGKWHVGDFDPTTRGFDEFYGFFQGYAVDSWNPRMLIRLPAGRPQPHYEPGKFYATDAITEQALGFLADARKTPDRPWFVYLAYQAPHFPVQAPAEEVVKYAKVYQQGWDKIREQRLTRMKQLGLVPADTPLTPRSPIPLPSAARRHGLQTDTDTNPPWNSLDPDRQRDLAQRMAIFAAMVEHTDRDIGRILADLRAHGETDNTLIMFLSDNGACAEWDPFGFDLTLPAPDTFAPGTGINMGTPRAPNVLHRGADLARMGGPGSYLSYGSAWANACNTPWRLYKHYDHEGGISAPMIVHWPAHIQSKGELRQQPGHVIDIMATCVDVAGAKYPAERNGSAIQPMEGRSLVPAFANQPLPRDYLAFEHEGNRAIRMGKWKLVALHGQPWELYNVEQDRTELHDLAQQQPERVARMAKAWDEWADRCYVRHSDQRASGPQPVPSVRASDGTVIPTPQIAGKALTISCEVEPESPDGVLLAQGGNQQGYSLWLRNGRLVFSVRVNREVASITASETPAGRFAITAKLNRDASMQLAINGQTVAEGRAPGLIPAQPIDELSIGEDSRTAVGDYDSPHPLRGKIIKVQVKTE